MKLSQFFQMAFRWGLGLGDWQNIWKKTQSQEFLHPLIDHMVQKTLEKFVIIVLIFCFRGRVDFISAVHQIP